MPHPRPTPRPADHLASMRLRHTLYARQHAAEIAKISRQITTEVTREGGSVTNLLRQLTEHTHRLQGEQKTLDLITEWATRLKLETAA